MRASEQIREDCTIALRGMTRDLIWMRPHGLTSAGFHSKHLAGSTRRLCVYLSDEALSQADLEAAAGEASGAESAGELISAIASAFARYEELVSGLKPESFETIRYIGRKRIAVTAVSLAIHIAEHGERHTGQLISAVKLAQALG
jgi:hypothetical protein